MTIVFMRAEGEEDFKVVELPPFYPELFFVPVGKEYLLFAPKTALLEAQTDELLRGQAFGL